MLRVLLGIVFAAVAAAEPVWVSFDGTLEPTPPTVTIVSGSPTSVTFHIVVHGMFVQDTVVDGQTYHVLQLPDEGMMADVGLPQLPRVTRLVGFAPGAAVTAQLAFNDEVILSGYHVFPAQCPADYPSPPPPFSINSAVYNSDVWFPDPGATASVFELGVWRDLGTAVAVVKPLVFNPVRQELRVHRSVTVTYQFAGGESLPVAVLPDYHGAYTPTPWRTSVTSELAPSLHKKTLCTGFCSGRAGRAGSSHGASSRSASGKPCGVAPCVCSTFLARAQMMSGPSSAADTWSPWAGILYTSCS
ncbi:MAG: C25 family peptidase propeptide domain-containing protein [candidate division WOR-3 bacterium]